MSSCIVIGCGVSGLSTALRLLEAGLAVEIWARDLPPHTTSNVAAAVWYPYRAYPEELVTAWSAVSYRVFVELTSVPESGVHLVHGLELFERPTPDPWWRDALPSFRHARPDELPAGYADGYAIDVPVVETPRYLQYLIGRVQAAGGSIVQRDVQRLAEPLASADVVVNCSGLGARELAGDASLTPIRGQTARVAPRPGGRFLIDEHGPRGLTYIVPRSDGWVLGGTAEEGAEDLTPDPTVERGILARCAALEPGLAGAAVLERKVGLRPGRPAVRLELERPAADRRLIHNYGHGGAGVTLSWGCADAVRALL